MGRGGSSSGAGGLGPRGPTHPGGEQSTVGGGPRPTAPIPHQLHTTHNATSIRTTGAPAGRSSSPPGGETHRPPGARPAAALPVQPRTVHPSACAPNPPQCDQGGAHHPGAPHREERRPCRDQSESRRARIRRRPRLWGSGWRWGRISHNRHSVRWFGGGGRRVPRHPPRPSLWIWSYGCP